MIQTAILLICIYAPDVPLAPACPMPPTSAWPGLPEVFLPLVERNMPTEQPFLCIPGAPTVLCFPEPIRREE